MPVNLLAATPESSAKRVDLAYRLETRYGEVFASEREDGGFDLAIDGHPFAALHPPAGIAALDVTLSLVKARGAEDYLIVDLGESGLRCRNEFFVLALGPSQRPRLSAPFGACHELLGAEYLKDGVEVILIESIFDAEGEGGEPEPKVARFRWHDGVMSEQTKDD